MLIPRFSVRFLLFLTTVCAVFFYIVTLAVQGSLWATAVSVAIAGLVLSMLVFFLYRYGRFHQRNYRKIKHLHALLVLMLMSMMLLTRAIQWVARQAIANLAEPFNQLDIYTYLIPLGAGAIIVALLSNGRIATVYTGFASLLFGAKCA